jgi:hypothetical protein
MPWKRSCGTAFFIENFLLANERCSEKQGDTLVQPLSFEHGLYRQIPIRKSGE